MDIKTISRQRKLLIVLAAIGMFCSVLSNALFLADVPYWPLRQSLHFVATFIIIACMLAVGYQHPRAFPWKLTILAALFFLVFRLVDVQAIGSELRQFTGLSVAQVDRTFRSSMLDIGIGLGLLAPLLLVINVSQHEAESLRHADEERVRSQELSDVKTEIEKRRKVEASLREAEERFRQIAENTDQIIYLTNADASETLFINPAYSEITGHSCQSLYDSPRSWLDLLHPNSRNSVAEKLIDFLKRTTSSRDEYEFRIIDVNQQPRWIQLTVIAIPAEGDRPARIAAVGKDITEKKNALLELQKSRDELEERVQRRTTELRDINQQLTMHSRLLRSVGVSITATDLDGRITYWSDASEALYGYAADEVLHRPLSELTLVKKTGFLEKRRIATVRRKGVWSGEYQQRRKDGTVFSSEATISLVYDDEGKATGFIGIDKDVTDKKQAESAQRESEARFQAIFDITPVPLCITRFDDGRILHVNSQMAKWFEIVGNQGIHRASPEYYCHPADRETVLHAIQTQGFVKNYEVQLWTKGKVARWFSLSIHVIPMDGQKTIITALYDVTARRDAEDGLRKSITTIRSMFDAFPDLQFQIRHDGTIVDYVSGDDSNLYIPPDEFMYRRVQDFLPPDIGKRFALAFHEVTETHTPVSLEYALDIADDTKHFEARIARIDDEDLLVVVREITERIHAQKALMESESRYRLLADNSLDVITRSTIDGKVLFVSPACLKEYGYLPDEIVGRQILEFMHPDDKSDFLSTWNNVSSEQDEISFVHRARCKDGSYKWVEARSQVVRDPLTRQRKESINISRDITDRIKAEEATRKSEYRYRTLVENMPMSCFTFDEQGRFLSWNRAAEESYGYTSDEAVAASCFDLIVPANARQATLDVIQRVFSGAAVIGSEWNDRNKRGDNVWRMGNAFPVFDELGNVLYGVQINVDVTEKKRAEQKLRLSEKLASIGTLAAGIAHQINNPLMAILYYAENAIRQLDPILESDDRAMKCVNGIQKETERCARIVESILTFSRGIESERERVDVVEIVSRARDAVLDGTNSQGTTIQMAVPASPINASVHPMLIEQMVVNLLENANEASAGQPVDLSVSVVEDRIQIKVIDQGHGIKADEKTRVFDPFFTTRRDAGGTGLGLSIVHGIVEHHAGQIEIISEWGSGTTVTVELPVAPTSVTAHDTRPISDDRSAD